MTNDQLPITGFEKAAGKKLQRQAFKKLFFMFFVRLSVSRPNLTADEKDKLREMYRRMTNEKAAGKKLRRRRAKK